VSRFHVLIGLLFAAMSASADMAEHAQRSQVAGIDLVTYVTGVKDVVIIHGALPAGDAFAGAGNADCARQQQRQSGESLRL